MFDGRINSNGALRKNEGGILTKSKKRDSENSNLHQSIDSNFGQMSQNNQKINTNYNRPVQPTKFAESDSKSMK